MAMDLTHTMLLANGGMGLQIGPKSLKAQLRAKLETLLEMMTASAINRFPVLGLSHGRLIAFRDLDALTTCGEAGLKGGFFNDLVLLDSGGYQYEVKGARKLGPVGPFGGFRLLRTPKIKIDLDLATPEKLSLEQAKQWVSSKISDSQGIDADATRAKILQAQTCADLVSLFY